MYALYINVYIHKHIHKMVKKNLANKGEKYSD